MRAKLLTTVTILTIIAFAPGQARTPGASGHDGSRDFELISVEQRRGQGNNDSDRASISADGRYVAFASLAENLVPGDTNFSSDIFVRDRATDRIERVSVGPLGVEGNGNSGFLSLLGAPDISADGRFVAFASEASNFVAGDVPGTADVFVRDRRTGTTELISRGTDGFPAGGGSVAPSISADGRFVAFRSFSDRLVPDGNPNFFDHVFVVDRRDASIERVDVASDGTLADGGAFNLAISADGRFVAFDSLGRQSRRRRRRSGPRRVRPRPPDGRDRRHQHAPADRHLHRHQPPLLDFGGRPFRRLRIDRSDARPPRRERVLLRCVRRSIGGTGTLRLVSRNSDGVQGNDDSFGALVSADGRFVVFSSRSSNLVRRDTNQSVDVFRRDLEDGTTERLAADDTSEDLPFGFEVIATDITPDAGEVALLTRADLAARAGPGLLRRRCVCVRPASRPWGSRVSAPGPLRRALRLMNWRCHVKMGIGGRPRSSSVCALALLPLFVFMQGAAGATRTEAQTKAYVAQPGANTVTVIDTATGTVTATLPVGAAPTRVAVTRDGSRAYVTNRDSDSISVIDTAADAVIETIPVGDSPTYLAVTPDGTRLYVMTASGDVEVVDTALGTVAATISGGKQWRHRDYPGRRPRLRGGRARLHHRHRDERGRQILSSRNRSRPHRDQQRHERGDLAGRKAGLRRRVHLQLHGWRVRRGRQHRPGGYGLGDGHRRDQPWVAARPDRADAG